jgi:mono/diheme cytochrome c family protein
MRYAPTLLAYAALLILTSNIAKADDASRTAPPAAQEGRTIYTRLCSRCHGYNMINNGLAGFDLRNFPKDAHERFVNSVRRGKLPKMPPWGDLLSDNEIEALWAYVQTGGGNP